MHGELDPSLILVSIEWPTHVVTLHRSDGAIGTAKLPIPKEYSPDRLRRTSWSPVLNGFLAETVDGDEIALEMPPPDGRERTDGRLVVYLDQCIWRRVADTLRDASAPARSSELAAARALVDLVVDRRVLVPLSSGHHSETMQWANDQRRYQLGLAALRASRGWQLRDPLALRREELAWALRAHVDSEPAAFPRPAITLDANATSERSDSVEVPANFSEDAGRMLQSLTYLSALVATLLDADAISPFTEKLAWVEVNQKFSDWLDSETWRTRAQKRRSVDVLLLNDLSREIAEQAHRTGLRPDQMSDWVRGPMFRDVESMPSLGLYRSVLQDRHLNVGTRWTANDLTDMVYLAAAAGYSDVVVAERHMTSMLRQAQHRLGRPLSVFPSLVDALPAIMAKLSDEDVGK